MNETNKKQLEIERHLDRVVKEITPDQWAKINKLVKPQQQINFDQLEKEAKEFFKKKSKIN